MLFCNFARCRHTTFRILLRLDISAQRFSQLRTDSRRPTRQRGSTQNAPHHPAPPTSPLRPATIWKCSALSCTHSTPPRTNRATMTVRRTMLLPYRKSTSALVCPSGHYPHSFTPSLFHEIALRCAKSPAQSTSLGPSAALSELVRAAQWAQSLLVESPLPSL